MTANIASLQVWIHAAISSTRDGDVRAPGLSPWRIAAPSGTAITASGDCWSSIAPHATTTRNSNRQPDSARTVKLYTTVRRGAMAADGNESVYPGPTGKYTDFRSASRISTADLGV